MTPFDDEDAGGLLETPALKLTSAMFSRALGPPSIKPGGRAPGLMARQLRQFFNTEL